MTTPETNAIPFPVDFDNVKVSMTIIRADGTVEPLGVVSSSKFTPFQRLVNDIRVKLLTQKYKRQRK